MKDKYSEPQTGTTATEATKTELAEAEIYDKFQPAFGGIYNVIDLAIVDSEKAKIARDLIGNILMNTRDKCIRYIKETFK